MNKKRTLLLTGIFVLLTAASLTLSCKKTGTLSYPGWNPYAREAIQKIIDEHGIKGAKYDPENRPYIVLDWDNTSIFNDCAHNLFVYQIDRVAFKLTPKEFS
ncbi:MAG: haloacid dehalogenase-like hydrolase, partial [bacterium]|nr:haloacid dehalogenase-like hydrolase [bacterium]